MTSERVTDKGPADLEMLAIWSHSASVIHAMRVSDNEGWSPGETARTVCGRDLEEAFLSVEVAPGDRPCGSCDRSTAVLPIMFETSDVMGDFFRRAADFEQRMYFMQWLSEGINRGWIDPPICGVHQEIESSGDNCVMVLRVDPHNTFQDEE